MKPGDDLEAWSGTVGERVLLARMFLSVHGFLSDAETRAANKRIEKWAAKHGFEITRDPHRRGTRPCAPIPAAETAPTERKEP